MAEDVRFLTGRTIYNRLGDLIAWLSLRVDDRGVSYRAPRPVI